MPLKVYVPPYLNEGFTQPMFTLSNNDWAYGSVNDIKNVKLFQGTTDQMRISLIAGKYIARLNFLSLII